MFKHFPWLPITLRIRIQISKVLHDLVPAYLITTSRSSLSCSLYCSHNVFTSVPWLTMLLLSTGSLHMLCPLPGILSLFSPCYRSFRTQTKSIFSGMLSLTTPCSPTIIGAVLIAIFFVFPSQYLSEFVIRHYGLVNVLNFCILSSKSGSVFILFTFNFMLRAWHKTDAQ